MLTVRKSLDRGHASHDWLDSYFSFSFAEYYDPAHMKFGSLRVINEDRIKHGTGFDMHGHQDMEIITYILEGALTHKDSMGTSAVLHPGEVQKMSAGSGIQHSEFNHAEMETHLLQIWIKPNITGIAPSYEQKAFSRTDKDGKLCLIASSDGRNSSVQIHQHADVYACLLDSKQQVALTLVPQRLVYVHVARGMVHVNGQLLQTGDAAKISEETAIRIHDGQQAEILLLDLPVS